MVGKSFSYPAGGPGRQAGARENYRNFDATELFCPNCNRAVPVRKHLLLVLPDGDKYEYRCAYCSASVGYKIERGEESRSIIF